MTDDKAGPEQKKAPTGGFIAEAGSPATAQPESLRALFRTHADRWKMETQHSSSVTKMLAHPSYLRIIGLSRYSTGTEIERLLLEELEREPDHWFPALAAVTGEDPVQPGDDFDQAVHAWLEWGRRKGVIQGN